MKLSVHAKPGAKLEHIDPPAGGNATHWKVSVKAPAKDGKANAAIEKALAKHFGVPASRVRVIKGFTSRKKIVEIA